MKRLIGITFMVVIIGLIDFACSAPMPTPEAPVLKPDQSATFTFTPISSPELAATTAESGGTPTDTSIVPPPPPATMEPTPIVPPAVTATMSPTAIVPPPPPATMGPTPSRPTLTPASPLSSLGENLEEFLPLYYGAINREKYRIAWNSLSKGFQKRVHAGNFNDYKQGYLDMQVCKIGVSDILVEERTDTAGIVSAWITFRVGDSCSAYPYHIRFQFVFDPQRDLWLLDRSTMIK